MLAAAAIAAGSGSAAAAEAADWRAVAMSHHDVVFIDADSVRRSGDGTIRFEAQHRLAENPSNSDFGYDRIDVEVSGRCGAPGDEPPPATTRRSYSYRGRGVAAPAWRQAGVAEDAAWIAAMVCEGTIGRRSFGDPAAAMAEYDEHDSLERLAASVSAEAELTGTVVQGFEMNGIALCGSEAGCREDAPSEFCWLSGAISVPTPAGAPQWTEGGPRRDTADLTFRGRIHRSRNGRGFGHVGAFGCQVEVTGPARPATIPRGTPPPAAERGSEGRRPAAIAAHAALFEAVRSGGHLQFATEARQWTIDELRPGTSDNGGDGACYSSPRFGGTWLDGGAPGILWTRILRIERDGPTLTLVTTGYSESLDFHLASPADAAARADLARRIGGRRLAGIVQEGRAVTLRFAGGGRERLRFADAAQAVEAAGAAQRLSGEEIAELRQSGARLTALPFRRMRFTFANAEAATGAVGLMDALRSACAQVVTPGA
jgi:hypothetical protein